MGAFVDRKPAGEYKKAQLIQWKVLASKDCLIIHSFERSRRAGSSNSCIDEAQKST
jgi:hypothetical protein